MEQQIRKQGKLSRHLLKVSLCLLICILYLVDAPEYARCHHLGICEFLEVVASLDATQEAAEMMAALSRLVGKFSDRGVIDDETDYFMAEERIYTPPSEDISLSVYYFLYRYINPYQNQRSLGRPFTYTGKVFIDHESTFPSLDHSISAKTLQIVTSTVIRS
jgi:hypothetical protein